MNDFKLAFIVILLIWTVVVLEHPIILLYSLILSIVLSYAFKKQIAKILITFVQEMQKKQPPKEEKKDFNPPV